MKIKEFHLLPLIGGTPDGGWTSGWSADENLHTLIELVSDEGVTGLGGIYTSRRLVEGAMGVLSPFLIGASALDPAATAETLHQNSFWQGRGGAITHATHAI